MIIDIHSHIFNERVYKEYFSKIKDKESRAIALYCWIRFNEKGKPVKFALKDLLDFAEKKDNLSVIAGINMDNDVADQLQSFEKLFQEKKIVGVKLYPGYQYFYPSDEKVYPIAELCEKYNKPLVFHSGDVYGFEDKGAILKYSHPIHIDELAVKYPKCKIIIAHFGFPYLLEAANVVYKNKNVYTDISGTITKDVNDTDKDVEEVFNQYVKDLKRVFMYFSDVKEKTMFGTDYSGENTTLNQVELYKKLVKTVFSKDEQQNVFYKLAEKLFFDK